MDDKVKTAIDQMGWKVDCHENREQWLDARRSMIGASDAMALLGQGYAGQSPGTVFLSKTGYETNNLDPAQQRRMSMGQFIEDFLRKLFLRETGVECLDTGDYTIFRSQEYEFLGATLDGLAQSDDGWVPVELKNVGAHNASKWKSGEPPKNFWIQVQHQLMVTGSHFGYLLGFIGGQDSVLYKIEADPMFHDLMLDQLHKFWQHVVDKRTPDNLHFDIDNYPLDHSKPTVELPDEALVWDEELVTIKRAIKSLTEEKKRLENLIKERIRENAFGRLPNGVRYSWLEQKYEIPAKQAYVRTSRVLRRITNE